MLCTLTWLHGICKSGALSFTQAVCCTVMPRIVPHSGKQLGEQNDLCKYRLKTDGNLCVVSEGTSD